MKQIRKLTQNKMTYFLQWLHIYNFCVVRSVDKRWNTLYPDIVKLYRELEAIGLEITSPP